MLFAYQLLLHSISFKNWIEFISLTSHIQAPIWVSSSWLNIHKWCIIYLYISIKNLKIPFFNYCLIIGLKSKLFKKFPRQKNMVLLFILFLFSAMGKTLIIIYKSLDIFLFCENMIWNTKCLKNQHTKFRRSGANSFFEK